MNHQDFVNAAIRTITVRAKVRAFNDLRDGFSPEDHQGLDATRYLPAANYSNLIAMRKAMTIPGRGGDHINA